MQQQNMPLLLLLYQDHYLSEMSCKQDFLMANCMLFTALNESKQDAKMPLPFLIDT